MKTLWLCFALVAVLLATAVAQTSQFDALTTITSATVTSDGIEIVNGLVEDDDFLYFYTLSPVVISKVNKSELAIEGSTPDIPSTRVQLSLGETVATALLVDGHVYLIGQRTVFKVSVANFSDVTTLVFPVDVNPMTSFYSEASANTQYLNFPSYGSGTPLFYQVRLDKFDLPPVNASRTFALPDGDDIQVTSYNGNGTAFMATYNGKFYKVAMESFSLQLNFSFSDISVVDVEYDNDRNTLYFCGDITPSLVSWIL